MDPDGGHLEPLTDEIGQEIWEKVPLWGFSWRLAYQSLPLTRDNYFERRWNQFMNEEVVPIVKSHAKDFLKASRVIAKETLKNREVAATLHDFVMGVVSDPDSHRLANVFVKEVIIDNRDFRSRLQALWKSPHCQHAFEVIAARLEVTVRRIGDILFGTREEGITPEFARVLRTQILEKDRRELLLDPGSPTKPRLDAGARLLVRAVAEESR